MPVTCIPLGKGLEECWSKTLNRDELVAVSWSPVTCVWSFFECVTLTWDKLWWLVDLCGLTGTSWSVSRGLFDLSYIDSSLCDNDKTKSPVSHSRPRMEIQRVCWYGWGKSQTMADPELEPRSPGLSAVRRPPGLGFRADKSYARNSPLSPLAHSCLCPPSEPVQTLSVRIIPGALSVPRLPKGKCLQLPHLALPV